MDGTIESISAVVLSVCLIRDWIVALRGIALILLFRSPTINKYCTVIALVQLSKCCLINDKIEERLQQA